MINENIKHFRKAKGLSQEELAVKLHVVRQTVSKWENGLSVPDADVLIRLANVLDVSVSQLLGIETEPNKHQALADQLADLNEQLALKNQQERNRLQADRKRGTILFLTFLTMLVALIVKNELVSLLLTGMCMISAAIILYRNLALLTNETTDDLRIGTLRVTTLINIGFLIIGILVACLTALDVITFSENGGACCGKCRFVVYKLYHACIRYSMSKNSIQPVYRAATALDHTRRRDMENCT